MEAAPVTPAPPAQAAGTADAPTTVVAEAPTRGMVRSHLIAGVDQPVPDTANIRELAGFLGHFMRVEIPDGRWFIGKFICVDGGSNIIMRETWEHRRFTWKDESGKEFSKEDKRNIGWVMVPGKYVQNVKVDRNKPPAPVAKPAAAPSKGRPGKTRGQNRRRRF